MREILFRGKLKEDKKWKFGDLITHGDKKTYILNDDEGYGEYDTGWGEEVYPDTVGQYTGLNDKNGVKIFEGDIVEIKKDRHYGNKKTLNKVCFHNACFLISQINSNLNLLDLPLFEYKCKDFQVIGNIHDNPELLEGK